ncbi:hypothetical protein BB558_006335 [Smittium angustum]|uniref:Hexosyltransferase n=1 Tax=Smittium angustum TaxID=133377 RepID=A0A2U1IY33_SMIAN|nr:hypothetical protein BB558_006335 [Smittium angustum]
MKAFGVYINRKKGKRIFILSLILISLLVFTLNSQKIQKKSNRHGVHKKPKLSNFFEDEPGIDFSSSAELDSLEFDKVSYRDITLNSNIAFIPRNKKLDMEEIFHEYLIIIPLAKTESIVWLRNLYSDLNLKILCDVDDLRSGCDIRTKNAYTYDTLPLKTYDMMKILCHSKDRYKAIVKMDFDIFINKFYFYNILKFLIKNSSRKIYYGDPMISNRVMMDLSMNGKVYAFTNPVLRDYCSCDIKRPTSGGLEDLWFGNNLIQCINSKNYKNKNEELFLLFSKEHHIYHKSFENNNVKLNTGSSVK